MIVEYILDILKPHHPGNEKLAIALKELEGVSFVKIKVDEIDVKTTSVYITIRGNEHITLEAIEPKLREYKCALHSVDEVRVYDEDILTEIEDLFRNIIKK